MIAINNPQVPTSPAPAGAARQFLTFELAETEYGLDILKVREIRVWEPVTPLPNTPPFVKGVINLRGSVVPIIDLRERLGLPPRSYGPRTVVIVVNVTQDEREKVMGMVVDAVCDEHLLQDGLISLPPDLGGPIGSAFVAGLAEVQGRMIVLLDGDRLLDLALGD
ncbi:MAG: purine-binding chemotaxis protein CheW [Chromatiaceae bacterium]|jgi:purine-binding chemotaxis protein CheW|nr:purine-binding chemotaxis protein CheW [Chromatiaceae bacterium]